MSDRKSKFLEIFWQLWEVPSALLMIIFIVFGFIALIAQIIQVRYAEYRSDKIMNGNVFGNKNSYRFHVPTCPDYLSIDERNVVVFKTIDEAESAGYRESRNCPEEIQIRRQIERGESNDEEFGGYEDPRQ